MKNLLVVANWKENKTQSEAKVWLEEFAGLLNNIQLDDKEIVVCPSFLSLPAVSEIKNGKNLQIRIGAQDVSRFESGAYTGELSARQIAEFAEFAIIGHSERRQNFGETDEIVAEKVSLALAAGITPIFCIQNENTPVPPGVKIVAYEPVEAIGTGIPDTPEDAERVGKQVKEKNSEVTHVLYGGSVTGENVASFINMENISGVLVGGASLEVSKFSSIVKEC